MKSLVLLTFLSLSPDTAQTTGKAEFFDDKQACQTRMQEIRRNSGAPGNVRCICHKTIGEVAAEGNDAI
jgi:hypothetical protein